MDCGYSADYPNKKVIGWEDHCGFPIFEGEVIPDEIREAVVIWGKLECQNCLFIVNEEKFLCYNENVPVWICPECGVKTYDEDFGDGAAIAFISNANLKVFPLNRKS